MLIVSDIDKTLCRAAPERLKFIEQEKPDWEGFLNPELVKTDLPIPEAQRGIKHIIQMGYPLMFITGRNESLRAVTTEWLLKHFDIKVDQTNLYMRRIDDFRVPSDVKREMLSKLVYVHNPANGWLCLDDDPFLMKTYREFNAIPMLAPDCWKYMFDIRDDLGVEQHWRA
jgi:hypothetical protein